jgi:uncharacterized protein DUF1190
MISAARAKRTSVVILGLMALALAGCGRGGGPTHGNGPRGVFTSTNDCVEHEKFDFKSCSRAVQTAIKIHNRESATYKSLRFCRAKELGCERTLNNNYRPRLLGFYVELPGKKDDKIIGKPLYAAADKAKGFRDHKNVTYLEKDLTLVFSRRAVATYETHSMVKKPSGFGS